MLNNEYSLSDIAAATGSNNDGFGNNGAWWIIILFLFAFCGWGNGNRGEGGAPAYDVGAGIRGVQNGLSDGFYAMNTGLLNGFSQVNQNVNGASAGLQNTLCQGFNGLNQGLNNIHYDMATNTCAINNSACNNTRDIIDSQNNSTRAILDAIEQSKVDSMQEKINSLQLQNQNLQFAASQNAQSNYLVNTLRPTPVPAYTAPNPFPPYMNGANFQ